MRLGMQIAFGCVHRKTASTGLGYLVYNSFLKLTPMVRFHEDSKNNSVI